MPSKPPFILNVPNSPSLRKFIQQMHQMQWVASGQVNNDIISHTAGNLSRGLTQEVAVRYGNVPIIVVCRYFGDDLVVRIFTDGGTYPVHCPDHCSLEELTECVLLAVYELLEHEDDDDDDE